MKSITKGSCTVHNRNYIYSFLVIEIATNSWGGNLHSSNNNNQFNNSKSIERNHVYIEMYKNVLKHMKNFSI